MQKNTSVTLGEHETKLSLLRKALIDGENSGPATYSLNDLISALDEDGE